MITTFNVLKFFKMKYILTIFKKVEFCTSMLSLDSSSSISKITIAAESCKLLKVQPVMSTSLHIPLT